MRPARIRDAAKVGQSAVDVCTCDSCCKVMPARLDLREKRGFGVLSRRKVDPQTGEPIK